jgi:hypothetical protein
MRCIAGATSSASPPSKRACFKRAGVALDAASKARLAEINERLATLGTSFSQNVLADEQDYTLVLEGEDDLAGLPDFVRAAAICDARLPFGIEVIDRVLPGGGLTLGALHEVAGGGNGAIDGAAAALFTAGIAARTKGKVLWCVTRQDLFAPALAQAGLLPGRVIYVEAGDDKALLACFEEGLRHGGLGAGVPPSSPRGRDVRRHRDRRPPLATADRGRRLRITDSLRHPLAHLRAPINSITGAGRWTRPMATRTDPVSRR